MVSVLDAKVLEVLEESSSIVGVFMVKSKRASLDFESNIESFGEFHTRLGMFVHG